MLDHLFVKNFQSHAETLLNFVPGINAIIGDPNSGKSALLRALQWVATNRPLGNSFIRRGETEARVQLVFRTGEKITAVTRVRGKSTNTYSLVNTSQDIEYTAFGNAPPDEILQALNLSELNYQPQLAPYFLVFESPGAVAQYIRAATGLEDVKKVLDVLGRRSRQVQRTVRDCQTDLEVVEQDLQSINCINTVRLEALIASAQTVQAESEALVQKIQTLSSIVFQLQEVQSGRVVLPEARLQEITSEVEELSSRFDQTSSIITTLKTIIDELCEVQEAAVQLPDTLDTLFSTRIDLEAEYNKLKQRIAGLGTVVSNLVTIKGESDSLVSAIQDTEQEVKQLRAQLSVCPSCGSVLTDETKKILLGEA